MERSKKGMKMEEERKTKREPEKEVYVRKDKLVSRTNPKRFKVPIWDLVFVARYISKSSKICHIHMFLRQF